MSDKANLLPFEGLSQRVVAAPLPQLDMQHTWFRVVRERTWVSLALVPTDESVAVDVIARDMAKMAAQEPDARVLVINAQTLHCSTAEPNNAPPPEDTGAAIRATVRRDPDYGYDYLDLETLTKRTATQALALLPKLLGYVAAARRDYSTVLISVDPILQNTRAIPAVVSADRTLVCVSLGHATFHKVRKITHIVGNEKCLGSLAVRPYSPPEM